MAEKWVVKKDALEKALKLIDIVPTRNGIKSSELLKVSEGNKGAVVFALSSDIEGKVHVKTDGTYPFSGDLFLDRRLLFPFLNGGKDSKTAEYVFLEKEGQVLVKHGNRKAVLAKPKDIGGYEDPVGLDKATEMELDKTWTSLIDVAATCATPDPTTPTLNCVYLQQEKENLEAMSSNGTLIFYGKVKVDKKLKSPIAFPLSLVKAITSDGAGTLKWLKKLALIEFARGKIWAPVKTEASKKFPVSTIKKFASAAASSPMVIEFNAVSFVKSVNRIAGYVAPLGINDMVLELHMTKGSKKVTLSSGSGDNRFNETVYALGNPSADYVIEWPLASVLPVILYSKDAGSVRIHQNKKQQSALITNELTLIIAKAE